MAKRQPRRIGISIVMLSTNRQNEMVSRKLSLVLLILVSLVTLWFGLRPLDFFPENRVRWLAGQDGIQFYKNGARNHRGSGGIIYSEAPVEIHSDSRTFEPATIEIYLESHGHKAGGLAHIVSFHDGFPRSPLVIGQWRDYLTIRSRDNKNPARDTYCEIGLKDGLKVNEKKLITIASGPGQTEIYVNGEPARTYDVRSFIGVEHLCGYLSLGNSAIGHNAWVGKLYGLAMYESLLTPERIREHYRLWTDGTTSELAAVNPEPTILYTFTEGKGNKVHNQTVNANHLTIPSTFKAIRRVVVLRFWRYMDWNTAQAKDILVNILGFVPFALCVRVFLTGNTRISPKQAAFVTILTGVILSLVIEISQIGLPTRTPSSLDLLCNTAGAALGLFAFRVLTNVTTQRRRFRTA